MRSQALTLLLLVVPFTAFSAEYFDKRFAPGYDLLDAGEFDKALDAFNELKTDTPESALVDYSIASVYYKKAVARMSDENKEGAIESLFKAKERFEDLIRIPDPFLKENVPFSSANCSAHIAKLYDPEAEFTQRVQALKTAIDEYDKVLLLDPKHKPAKKNRDHLSYLLKKMLQDAPPEQQQPDEGDGGDESNEGDEEKEGEDPNDGENEDENEGEEGEEDDSEGESQDEDSESDDQSKEGEQQQSSENGKSPEEENIEAILESLEAINEEEQKNLRRAQRPPQIKGGKWW